jgi:hypothetical protein
MLLNDYQANGRPSLDRAGYAVAHLHEFFTPEARVVAITPDQVTAYRVHRQGQAYQGKPVANATINYRLAMLRRALRLGARAGKFGQFPEVETLHIRKRAQGLL